MTSEIRNLTNQIKSLTRNMRNSKNEVDHLAIQNKLNDAITATDSVINILKNDTSFVAKRVREKLRDAMNTLQHSKNIYESISEEKWYSRPPFK